MTVDTDRSAGRRLVLAWVVVVAITLTYLVLEGSADDDGTTEASMVAPVAAIALALLKIRIVMREFMDVRHAPKVLRTMTDLLVVTMGAALLGTYLVGRALS